MNKACFEHIFFLLFRHNKFKKDKIYVSIKRHYTKNAFMGLTDLSRNMRTTVCGKILDDCQVWDSSASHVDPHYG